jgi:hypothetical protein
MFLIVLRGRGGGGWRKLAAVFQQLFFVRVFEFPPCDSFIRKDCCEIVIDHPSLFLKAYIDLEISEAVLSARHSLTDAQQCNEDLEEYVPNSEK